MASTKSGRQKKPNIEGNRVALDLVRSELVPVPVELVPTPVELATTPVELAPAPVELQQRSSQFTEKLGRLLGLGFEEQAATSTLLMLEGASFETVVAYLFQLHGVNGLDTEQAKRARNQYLKSVSLGVPRKPVVHDEVKRAATLPHHNSDELALRNTVSDPSLAEKVEVKRGATLPSHHAKTEPRIRPEAFAYLNRLPVAFPLDLAAVNVDADDVEAHDVDPDDCLNMDILRITRNTDQERLQQRQESRQQLSTPVVFRREISDEASSPREGLVLPGYAPPLVRPDYGDGFSSSPARPLVRPDYSTNTALPLSPPQPSQEEDHSSLIRPLASPEDLRRMATLPHPHARTSPRLRAAASGRTLDQLDLLLESSAPERDVLDKVTVSMGDESVFGMIEPRRAATLPSHATQIKHEDVRRAVTLPSTTVEKEKGPFRSSIARLDDPESALGSTPSVDPTPRKSSLLPTNAVPPQATGDLPRYSLARAPPSFGEHMAQSPSLVRKGGVHGSPARPAPTALRMVALPPPPPPSLLLASSPPAALDRLGGAPALVRLSTVANVERTPPGYHSPSQAPARSPPMYRPVCASPLTTPILTFTARTLTSPSTASSAPLAIPVSLATDASPSPHSLTRSPNDSPAPPHDADDLHKTKSYYTPAVHADEDDEGLPRSYSLRAGTSLPLKATGISPPKAPPSRNILDFFFKPKHERQPSVVIYESRPLYQTLPAIDPSSIPTLTTEKSRKLKFIFERQLPSLFKALAERETRRHDLEKEMRKMNLSDKQKAHLRLVLDEKESEYLRSKRATIDKSHFATVKTIGRGAFGEVMLVRKKDTQQLYAMKTLRKSEIVQRNQVARVKAERDILSAADNEWLVKLFYSFQDKDNLYFVMEYVPGGDLMNLLIKLGRFPEDMARFYTTELVMVVQSVHQMGFIHRDVKPDNILIDAGGHIKLTDFGLCTGLRRNDPESSLTLQSFDATNPPRPGVNPDRRTGIRSLVGTPNYIAPEVFQRSVYGKECDWWSVGVILFEMAIGYPPFAASTPHETRHRVINWRQYLAFPRDASPLVKDLVERLCCDAPHRIKDAEEIKVHPFFRGVSWDRTNAVPFTPRITHDTDTSNFGEGLLRPPPVAAPTLLTGDNPEFLDFNFQRFWDGGRTASGSSRTTSYGSNKSTRDF